MATTADYLTQLQADKQTLVDNLVAKGVEASNDETFTTLAPKVADIPTGEPIEEEWDTSVDFVDIDGELLYHYTQEEIQALEELPLPPEHEYLEFTHWNWSLEELKEWGKGMVVGAIYHTTDGNTKILITIDEPTDVTMYLVTAQNGYIDWGDGNRDEVNRTSKVYDYHTYQEAGNYVITIAGTNVRIENSTYSTPGFYPKSIITDVYVGDGHYIGWLGYEGFDNTKTLVIPENCEWSSQYGFQPTDYENLLAFIAPKSINCRISLYSIVGKYISVPKYSGGIYISGCNNLKRFTPAYFTSSPVGSWNHISLENLPSLKEVDASYFNTSISIKNLYNLTKFKNSENKYVKIENAPIEEIVLYVPPSNNQHNIVDNTSIKKIVVPNTYTQAPTISSNKYLEEIELADTVTTLPSSFGYSCYNLKKVKGIENIKTITGNIFNSTYFLDIDISVFETLPNNAFNNMYGLTKAIFNENITELPKYVCSNCYLLEDIVLPPNLTTIGDYAFNGVNLKKELIIPEKVTSIGHGAFTSYILKKVTFKSDENLITLGNSNFAYVEKIKFPNSLQAIPNYFYGYQLSKINIPRDCTSIGTSFCSYAITLTEVDATKCTQVPSLGSNAFRDIKTKKFVIKVPSSLYDEWISTTNWSAFADYIEAVEVE